MAVSSWKAVTPEATTAIARADAGLCSRFTPGPLSLLVCPFMHPAITESWALSWKGSGRREGCMAEGECGGSMEAWTGRPRGQLSWGYGPWPGGKRCTGRLAGFWFNSALKNCIPQPTSDLGNEVLIAFNNFNWGQMSGMWDYSFRFKHLISIYVWC